MFGVERWKRTQEAVDIIGQNTLTKESVGFRHHKSKHTQTQHFLFSFFSVTVVMKNEKKSTWRPGVKNPLIG